MTIEIGKPNPKQDLFLRDTHKHVAFGGARGGGKSWAIRTKAIILCLGHPGIRCMIVRKTYPELTANHIDPLKETLKIGASDSVATYNKSDKEMTFINGSKILFRYCDSESDVDRYQGTQTDVLFLDEATQLSEMQMKKIVACVRGVNEFPKRIYYTCNPGGIGHQYIKRLFIDRHFLDNEDPNEYSFIQSLVTDNEALMKSDSDYIKQLEALPESLRKGWLLGSWDIYEGQFFEEFKDDPAHYKDRQWTHVIEPFDIPREWKIYQSYDFGYSKPFSFQWWAVDPEGVAYLIVELYGCTNEPNEGVKWIASEQAEKVKDVEAMHPLLKGRKIAGRIADPAIWDGSRGESVQETFAKNQIYFTPGDNARIPGWMQFHYRLYFDRNGYSMMYVFNTCKHFIRTIPLMTYSTTIPEDLDTTLEDHIADSTRYFLMSKPIAPRIKETKQIPISDPLNMFAETQNKGTVYNYKNI